MAGDFFWAQIMLEFYDVILAAKRCYDSLIIFIEGLTVIFRLLERKKKNVLDASQYTFIIMIKIYILHKLFVHHSIR